MSEARLVLDYLRDRGFNAVIVKLRSLASKGLLTNRAYANYSGFKFLFTRNNILLFGLIY